MSKLRKVYRVINDKFSDKLGAAFTDRFQMKLSTSWNIIDMRLVSRREDGRPLTKEQSNWIDAYSHGYTEAMDQVTLKEDGTRE